MENQTIILKPDGSADVKVWEGKTRPDLPWMQAAVGGYIETVPHFNKYNDQPCVAYCDEEGLYKDTRHNTHAVNAWTKCLLDQVNGDRSKLNFDMIGLKGDILILTGSKSFINGRHYM